MTFTVTNSVSVDSEDGQMRRIIKAFRYCTAFRYYGKQSIGISKDRRNFFKDSQQYVVLYKVPYKVAIVLLNIP